MNIEVGLRYTCLLCLLAHLTIEHLPQADIQGTYEQFEGCPLIKQVDQDSPSLWMNHSQTQAGWAGRWHRLRTPASLCSIPILRLAQKRTLTTTRLQIFPQPKHQCTHPFVDISKLACNVQAHESHSWPHHGIVISGHTQKHPWNCTWSLLCNTN